MSEASSIAKLVIILGIVFLLIGLIFPGQDAAWNGFRTTLAGQGFPAFSNPFGPQIGNATMRPRGDGDSVPPMMTDNDAVADCSTSAVQATPFWGCVRTQDGDTSYATTNATDNQFSVAMTHINAPASGPVLSVTITLQCRTPSSVTAIDVIFELPDNTIIADVQGIHCEPGAFVTQTLDNGFVSLRPIVDDMTGHKILLVSDTPYAVDFSYLSVNVVYGLEPECNPGNTLSYIGCVISAILSFLINLGHLLVNVVVFGAQLIFFALTLVYTLFVGLFGTLGWFFAIPGAPPIVQILMTSIFVGVIAYVLYIILKIFTGMIGGINPV